MAKLQKTALFLTALLFLVSSVYADGTSSVASNGYSLPLLISATVVVLIAVITLYLTFKISFLSMKLIIGGIAMIFIGTVLLIYGDYNGGIIYVFLGAAFIIIGVILLILGDLRAGAFNERIAKWLEDVAANK